MVKTIALRIAIWALPGFLVGLLAYWGFIKLTGRITAKAEKDGSFKVGDKAYKAAS